jgi:predicted Zn-dependent protease with MMP-like domain
VNQAERDRFDALVEEVIAGLPPTLRALIEEIPVIVLDRPDRKMLEDLGMDPDDDEAASELCGLHTGVSITEKSIEHAGELPTEVHLFREGIVNLAGGWEEDPEGFGGGEAVREEIQVTLLHEIGHHFGLEEDDLFELGYD